MRKIMNILLKILVGVYATSIFGAAQPDECKKKKVTVYPNRHLDVARVAGNICELYDTLSGLACTRISNTYKVRLPSLAYLNNEYVHSDYTYNMTVSLAVVEDKGCKQTLLEFKRDRPWRELEKTYPHRFYIKEIKAPSRKSLFLVDCNNDKMNFSLDMVVMILFNNDIIKELPQIHQQNAQKKPKEHCLIV